MRRVLFLGFGLVVVSWAINASASKVIISYEYNSVGICVGAEAHLEDDATLIGKAKLEDLVKGEYFRVRLWHYYKDGNVKYEAIAKFSIGLGNKISEEKVRGEKHVEVFSTWPS